MDIPSTRGSLIAALQSLSPDKRSEALAKFDNAYGPVIECWCRLWPQLKADAGDLKQDILVKLIDKFARHLYDPAKGSFRGWLKTIVKNTLKDVSDQRARRPGDVAVGGNMHDEALAQLADSPAADQLSDAMADSPVSREYRALARVKADASEAHWTAFNLYVGQRWPAKRVAEATGLSPANVAKVAERIRKSIAEEMSRD